MLPEILLCPRDSLSNLRAVVEACENRASRASLNWLELLRKNAITPTGPAKAAFDKLPKGNAYKLCNYKDEYSTALLACNLGWGFEPLAFVPIHVT